MEQLSLFQDKYMLLNDAVAAIKALRLADATAALRSYAELYHSGEEVEGKQRLVSYLQEAFSAAPPSGADLPPYLFRLWRSLVAFCPSLGPDAVFVSELRRPFFQKIVTAIAESPLTDSDFLAAGVPTGYAYLQIGEYNRAIASLQTCLITNSDNARIYGYLGDAHMMRGDVEVARQLYFEACQSDPAALDWDHLQDEQLKELLVRLPDEYGLAPALTCAWLPAHAYVHGLFRPKQIRLLDVFQALSKEYLELLKKYVRTTSPGLAARLFLKGIVLCDNQPFFYHVRGMEFAEVRRMMKTANAALFTSYLKEIERRKPRGL